MKIIRVKPTIETRKQFKELCKNFVEGKVSVDVVLHWIQLKRWFKIKK